MKYYKETYGGQDISNSNQGDQQNETTGASNASNKSKKRLTDQSLASNELASSKSLESNNVEENSVKEASGPKGKSATPKKSGKDSGKQL